MMNSNIIKDKYNKLCEKDKLRYKAVFRDRFAFYRSLNKNKEESNRLAFNDACKMFFENKNTNKVINLDFDFIKI